MQKLETEIFSAPRSGKLWRAASARPGSISLYITCEATREKARLSAPSPPVRSAILPPLAILLATEALYLAVAEELDCSELSLSG